MKSANIHGHVRQALNRLLDLGWEVEEVTQGTEWWANKILKLSSTKQSYGMKLFITPQTDPQNSDQNSQDIDIIRASTNLPTRYNDDSNIISECFTNSRGFEGKLDEFISQIEDFRNTF